MHKTKLDFGTTDDPYGVWVNVYSRGDLGIVMDYQTMTLAEQETLTELLGSIGFRWHQSILLEEGVAEIPGSWVMVDEGNRVAVGSFPGSSGTYVDDICNIILGEMGWDK